MNDFGRLIKILRNRAGLTQKDLAIKLGTDDSTISKWERNKNLPDVSIVAPIAKVLNVTCDELLHPTETLEKLDAEQVNNDSISCEDITIAQEKTIKTQSVAHGSKREIFMLKQVLLACILLFAVAIGICAYRYIHDIKTSEEISIESQFQLVETRTNVESAKGPAYELIYFYPIGTSRDLLVSHAESISAAWRNGEFSGSTEETLIVSYYSSIEDFTDPDTTGFRIYFLKNPPQ